MTDAITLSDDALDRAILGEMGALDRALGCAVLAAWELGRKLAVRKRRLDHGQWLPYLDRIGLPARTAQEAMWIASKYAQRAHLPGTMDDARALLRASPVERRHAETLEAWPELRARLDDPKWRTVVEAYVRLSAFMCGGKDWPSKEEMAWLFGVERLFEAEFRGAA